MCYQASTGGYVAWDAAFFILSLSLSDLVSRWPRAKLEEYYIQISGLQIAIAAKRKKEEGGERGLAAGNFEMSW